MSSSSNYSSSSSESEAEENFNEESVEYCGVVLYDQDLEPLATEEAWRVIRVKIKRKWKRSLVKSFEKTMSFRQTSELLPSTDKNVWSLKAKEMN